MTAPARDPDTQRLREAIRAMYTRVEMEPQSVELYWYKPGHNTPARKQTYVRKVQSGQDTYIVGSGVYMEE